MLASGTSAEEASLATERVEGEEARESDDAVDAGAMIDDRVGLAGDGRPDRGVPCVPAGNTASLFGGREKVTIFERDFDDKAGDGNAEQLGQRKYSRAQG